MGQWPTHKDESAFLGFIDSKQVTRDFRGSAPARYALTTFFVSGDSGAGAADALFRDGHRSLG